VATMSSGFVVTTGCETPDKTDLDTRSEASEAVDTHVALCEDCGEGDVVIEAGDGGPEIVDDAEPVGPSPEQVQEEYDLPDEGPSVDEDPLVWMPDEFTKTVDGTVTISRKGYEVLAHHYDIQGGTELVVSPVETDMEYVVHKATVTDADGDEYTAYGEAHASDNGVENIVRMSDTRAYKRAVSRATGVGTVAIEELQGEL